MKKIICLIGICAFALLSGANALGIEPKEKLLMRIQAQQEAAEKTLLNMWVNKKRGKEFEALLGEYVVREIRSRAMSGKNDTGTLLSQVSKESDVEASNPVELGRLIVLEYFKRKGVHLKNKRFVKGSYMIGLRQDQTYASN